VLISEHEEHETRRIILLRLGRGRDPEVLLRGEETQRHLPRVRITRRQRIADQLTAAFKELYGMDAVSLSRLEGCPVQAGSVRVVYEIMEPSCPLAEAGGGNFWVRVDSLAKSELHDRNDLQAVSQAAAQSISVEAPSLGPFANLGWFHELEQWVQKEIRPHGLHLSGRFRQLNADRTFCLIRFETDGPAVWFKAVGAPNERECALTLALAHSFPRFLPQVIATRPDCNGWLAMEAEGAILHECSSVGSWETAARDLARLQIQSIDKCASLLDLGAHDLRISELAPVVEPFLRAMGEVMDRQTKIPPARLSREQLRTLSARVQSALRLLEETGVPTTLGHMDLNPGNIVCGANGCVFLDWVGAFVGHPWLALQYLLEHHKQSAGPNRVKEMRIVASYSGPWRALVPDCDVRRSCKLAPLVAVFAYAAESDLWKKPRRQVNDRAAGYLRSLTRRMEREAGALWEGTIHA